MTSRSDSATSSSTDPHLAYKDEEVDLRKLVHAVWRHRAFAVLLAFIGGLAGLGYSYLSTRYVSEGVLLTPEIRVEDYKRYVMALVNESKLEEFLRSSGQSDTKAAELLRSNIESPMRFAASVSPEFSFTDRDARLFGVTTDQPSELVGIRLQMVESRKSAEPPVLLLAEYVRSLAIKLDIGSAILKECLENQLHALKLRGEELEDTFRLEQVQRTANSLREIIQDLPDAASLENMQVISLVKGNERFLSPTTQLVGAEIEMVELGLAQRARERELIGSQIRRDYTCAAKDELEKPISAREFLLSLRDIRARVLEGQDLSLNAVEVIANDLDLQRLGWENKYLSQMRFAAAPEGRQVRIRQPGLAIGLAIGTAFGSLLGVLLAVMLAWWRENRAVIVALDPD